MLGAALAAGSPRPPALVPSTVPLPSFRRTSLRVRAAASPANSGTSLAILSSAAFASLGVLGTFAFQEGVNLLTMLAGRFTLASLVFWIILRRRGTALPPLRVTLAALALGAGVYALESGLLFAALDRLQNAALLDLLLYAYPAIVTIAVVAMGRERLTGRRVAALAVSSLGVVLVVAGGAAGALDAIGVAMAIGAAVLYSAYVLVADALLRRTDALAVATLTSTGAAIAFVATALATGSLQSHVTLIGTSCIVAIAVVSTVLALLASFGALERLGPSKASIVSTVEPPLTAVLAAVFLGVALAPVQIAGGVLVLSAVVILQARLQVPGRIARSLQSRVAAALPD
jgi:drug/metabolite transporter (DMT)-like permease